MQDTMRYAEHFLDAVLGQDADVLAVAIDKCKTLPELRTQLEKTRNVIEGMGKKRKAEEFWTAAQALLEGKPLPSETASPVPAQPAAAPAVAPAPVPPPAAPPLTAAPAQPSMQEAARFARRYILEKLGPDGDSLVEAIEKCKTLPELRARLEKTREALEAIGSKRKAEEFWAGVQSRLPAA